MHWARFINRSVAVAVTSNEIYSYKQSCSPHCFVGKRLQPLLVGAAPVEYAFPGAIVHCGACVYALNGTYSRSLAHTQ